MVDINLMQGDCLELMQRIPPASVDMVLCDLPYGTTSKNVWDKVIPFNELWQRYNRVVKPNAAILLFGQPPFSSQLVCSNISMFRYEWIWVKPLPVGFLNANRMPMRATENISVFYHEMPIYIPQKTRGQPYSKGENPGNTTTNYGDFGRSVSRNDTGDRYPTNVLNYTNADHTNICHPTQKPTALLEYLIRTYTLPGGCPG